MTCAPLLTPLLVKGMRVGYTWANSSQRYKGCFEIIHTQFDSNEGLDPRNMIAFGCYEGFPHHWLRAMALEGILVGTILHAYVC